MGSAGTWDNSWINSGSVLFDGTKYHLWYSGGDTISGLIKIGHATSTNAITWTKDSQNPVLEPFGTPGNWELGRAELPSVLFDGAIYHMWYSAGIERFQWNIGYATSSDGVTWKKDTRNPVLRTGESGTWDSRSVACMSVLDLSEGKYEMWYFGSKLGVSTCIGLAELSHQ
jgi:sucrose-6-phosphate hydrolase SacC (GH32 family)